MRSRPDARAALASLLAFLIVSSPAHALVTLDDGHDHIYVTGTAAFGWDSNVYANRDSTGDFAVNTSLLAEYTRRAGWIGVNGSVAVASSRYGRLTSEDFNNPRFSLELTKQSGRTTGSMTFNAARESRADAAVNVRTTSWNYDTGLNFKYPFREVYTLSGQLGYADVKYVEGVFPDLATYTASADLIRVFSSDRDVILGYRYRDSATSLESSYEDHALTAGLTGKLIRGINGSLRFGYQERMPHGFTNNGATEGRYGSWTSSGSASFGINKRTNLTTTLSKDFATTASDTSVDTLTAQVLLEHAFSSHWTANASVSGGDSRFLGQSGRVIISLGPPLVLGPSRHDDFLSASVAVNYSLNEHLKIGANYTWFKNWSTSSYSDFVRSSYSLNVSSRW